MKNYILLFFLLGVFHPLGAQGLFQQYHLKPLGPLSGKPSNNTQYQQGGATKTEQKLDSRSNPYFQSRFNDLIDSKPTDKVLSEWKEFARETQWPEAWFNYGITAAQLNKYSTAWKTMDNLSQDCEGAPSVCKDAEEMRGVIFSEYSHYADYMNKKWRVHEGEKIAQQNQILEERRLQLVKESIKLQADINQYKKSYNNPNNPMPETSHYIMSTSLISLQNRRKKLTDDTLQWAHEKKELNAQPDPYYLAPPFGTIPQDGPSW